MEGIVLLIGMMIGSFLNVCIYRIPENQSIVYPASHCSNCNTPLKPLDLIPIFSYILLRGKCRYCTMKFSIRYPMVELLTGMIFLLLFFRYGFTLTYFFHIILICILICITFIDYDHQIIPDGLVLLGFGLGLLYKLTLYFIINQPVKIVDNLFGFLLGGGFFLLIAVISNGGMGGGDIKLMAMLGFLFGWRDILLVALLSFVTGSILSILLLAMKIKSRKDAIPFGPFIALAALLTMIYREPILNWYMTFF